MAQTIALEGIISCSVFHFHEDGLIFRFHELSHTSATLLIAGKQDIKTVSSRLGHAQTLTTMNIYTHVLQEGDRKAAETLETILKNRA